MLSLGLRALLIFLSFGYCLPYIITLDTYSEECFFEKVPFGDKLGITYEVFEGGFLDINFQVRGPDNEEIINRQRETNGKVVFVARKAGTYTYCFSNQMSTLTPKQIMFTISEIKASAPIPEIKNEPGNSTKLNEMIQDLSDALKSVKHEQEYMLIRDRLHHKINESSNSRVLFWSFFESFILLTMAIGQVYYLKRFFEVRCII